MSHHLNPLKNNSKNYIIPHHLSSLGINFENSTSMRHHLMPHHFSLLKNNSKNSGKSPDAKPSFSVEK
jgi:hypothetical protein